MAGAFQTHHLQPHTTVEIQPKSNHDHHHGQNLAKIKSQQKPRSPAHQIINQITPTEIKAQNPQNNQNHKMKTLKVNPPIKKHILIMSFKYQHPTNHARMI